MHRAACVQAALRLRHRAHDNLARGRVRQHEVTHGTGVGCATQGLLAGWCPGTARGEDLLLIQDLRTGRALHRWPLPNLCYGASPGWAWHGKILALDYGDADQDVGVLLVDTSTGSFTHVVLPNAQLHIADYPPEIISRSSQGLLLVHRQNTDSAGCTLSIVDALGCVLSSAAFPEGLDLSGYSCWSPDGRSLVLRCDSTIWLWKPETQGQPVLCELTGVHECSLCAWAFDSSSLVLADSSGEQLLFWRSQQEQALEALKGDALERVRDVSWGSSSRIALICDATLGDWPHLESVDGSLRFYQRSSEGELRMVRAPSRTSETVARLHTRSGNPLSPDGNLICLATASLSDGSARHQHGVDFLTMDGHLLARYVTPFMAFRIEWGSDGASVLVSTQDWDSCLLFDLA